MPDNPYLFSAPGTAWKRLAASAFEMARAPYKYCCLGRVLVAAFVCLALAAPVRAEPEGLSSPWEPVIGRHANTPERLIAVDKSQQRLFLLERKNPPAKTPQYVCTTGRVKGDKAVEGDLKTPEGIYFIVQYIGSGLDYIKYGNEAYTLNYPNPVDRLRKKTGYGIWIHGRGEPLVPLQTEGCVAMINEDLAGMKPVLLPGTPVALAGSLSFAGKEGKEDPNSAVLAKKVQAWAEAWASRSSGMFDFYDKEAYAIAQGEPFSRFQAQKERLFKILPWINTTVQNIQVLQGPGYWVTWFYQDYQAPNLTTKGVRRLYWTQDQKGEFKIVGMEWAPGMTTSTLLAAAEPALPPIEAQPRTEEQAARQDAPGKEDTPPDASAAASPAPPPLAAVRDHVEDPSMGTMPEPPLAAIGMLLSHAGRNLPSGEWTGSLEMPEKNMAFPAPVPKLPLVTREPAEQQTVAAHAQSAEGSPGSAASEEESDSARGRLRDDRAISAPSAESSGNSSRKPATGTGILARALAGVLQAAGSVPSGKGGPPPAKAPMPAEQADSGARPEPGLAAEEPEAFPDAAVPAPPAVEPPSREAARRVLAGRTLYSLAATDIFYPPGGSRLLEEASPAEESSLAEASPAAGRASFANGAETAASGTVPAALPPLAAAREQEAPDAPHGRENASAAELAATVHSVSLLIEEWRKQWQAGDLEKYMAFYAPAAVQGARKGARAIQRQKKSLWSRVSPTRVTLSDVRIVVKDGAVLADMRQDYVDSSGRSDTGIKTLTLDNINGAWLITREDWSAIPNEAGN